MSEIPEDMPPSTPPPVVEYKSPDVETVEELQVPTSSEVEAAKWYTIGFLIVLGVFTIGAVWIMISLAMHFFVL